MFNLDHLAQQKILYSHDDKCISGLQFLADVDGYRQKIQLFIKENPTREVSKASAQFSVILFHPDVYQFAVRLFALASENIKVILPANGQLKTLENLFPVADALSGEFDCKLSLSSIDVLARELSFEAIAPIKREDNLLWPVDVPLVFSTSGSTGQAKLVEKSWRQLSTELATLAATFELDKSTVFLSTVSHQHIYGLLFRLLWPLSQGAIIEQTIEYPEHGSKVLQQFSSVVLVSSPAFLKRLALDNVLAKNKQNIHKIFSSGGPLADMDALELYQQFGQGVIQVYGSTETGGIGYRSVTALPAPNWQTFAQISLTVQPATQRLCLNSPYVNEQNMLLDDKGDIFEHGYFSLLGRVDRTIKLEEKRLNLDDVEQYLLTSLYVNECRVMVLNDSRSTLVAIVCLSEKGLALKATISTFEFSQQMKQHLLGRFERVCLPRKWRYLDKLPYNSQGKLSHAALEALFE